MKKPLFLLILFSVMLSFNTTLNAQQKTDTTKKTKQAYQPIALVAGMDSGVISKEILLKADSVTCTDKSLKIVHFTMTIMKNGSLIEMNNSNNVFTSEMIKNINELTSGSKVFFENIQVKFFDGSTRVLNSIILKLK